MKEMEYWKNGMMECWVTKGDRSELKCLSSKIIKNGRTSNYS